jgi:hypothetical protein
MREAHRLLIIGGTGSARQAAIRRRVAGFDWSTLPLPAITDRGDNIGHRGLTLLRRRRSQQHPHQPLVGPVEFSADLVRDRQTHLAATRHFEDILAFGGDRDQT